MELRVPHVTSYARAPSSLLFLRSARYPQMPRFLQFWFGSRGAGIRRLTGRQENQSNQYLKERLIRHTGQSGHGSGDSGSKWLARPRPERREFWPMPLPLMIHSAIALFAQRTRIPTSARSIGFCVIWVCISSSSSSIAYYSTDYRSNLCN